MCLFAACVPVLIVLAESSSRTNQRLASGVGGLPRIDKGRPMAY